MFRTLLEAKKAEAEAEYKKYTKVRKSVYEYLGIPQSTYLICTDNVKSKMFSLGCIIIYLFWVKVNSFICFI